MSYALFGSTNYIKTSNSNAFRNQLANKRYRKIIVGTRAN